MHFPTVHMQKMEQVRLAALFGLLVISAAHLSLKAPNKDRVE